MSGLSRLRVALQEAAPGSLRGLTFDKIRWIVRPPNCVTGLATAVRPSPHKTRSLRRFGPSFKCKTCKVTVRHFLSASAASIQFCLRKLD
jgi:hypothetical protein